MSRDYGYTIGDQNLRGPTAHQVKQKKKALAAAATAVKHKKIQAKVNKHLAAASALSGNAAHRNSSHHSSVLNRRDSDKAREHASRAAAAKSKLPPGYAMVFGKLRKINPKGKRTGIAKLKR
jgi:hypothetical protein